MLLNKKSDKEILDLFMKGDEEAVKVSFERYYESLCLYAESFLINHQAAEEIVEDLFIYLWVNASKLHIETSLKSYLYRSTHNNCISYLQKRKTEKKHFEELHYLLEDKEILYPVSPDYPIANLIVQELEKKADEVLESLPKQCKEIYFLCRFENLSYSQAASKLNITVGTVKTQMSRAFNRFRDELKDFMPLILMILGIN